MPSILSRYATPLITALFVISLVSGVALFFHFGSATFHSMHEWLSMVLILPFVLHIWKNWRAFSLYFKRPAMAASLGVSLVAAIALAVPALTGSTEGRALPPEFAVARTLQAAPLADVAPVFGREAEDLASTLREKGFQVASTSDSIDAVASASGQEARAILAVLNELPQQ